MFQRAIPVLHVSSSAAAEEFYCARLGFHQEFAYRPFGGLDPCYMGLARDEARLHVSSFSGDGISGGVVFIVADDVDALHDEFISHGAAIDLPPTEQTWGNREMYLSDPDGNSVRFVRLANG